MGESKKRNLIGAIFLILLVAAAFILLNLPKDKKATTLPEIDLQEICINATNTTCTHRDTVTKKNPLFAQFEDFKKKQIFTFRNDTNYSYVKFTCSASFPVTWIHSQDEWISRTTDALYHVLRNGDILHTRHTSNALNPTTFQYSAILRLNNGVNDVGEYLCKRVNVKRNETNTAKMTVFKQKSLGHPYHFPLSGQNITVWMEERDDGKVLLPCFVSNPDVHVNLSILVYDGKWENVLTGEGITYLPELGFLQESGNYLSPGIFKCSSDSDQMFITLESGKGPQALQVTQKISPPARFAVDVYSKSKHLLISCCSNTTDPPVMRAVYCTNKISCDKYVKYKPDLNLSWAINATYRKRNCRNLEGFSLHSLSPLLIRCTGKGVDIQATLLSPLYHNKLDPSRNLSRVIPFTSWAAINASQLMDFYPDNIHPAKYSDGKLVMFDDEAQLNFTCYAASWYFPGGMTITLNYTNGSSISIESNSQSQGLWLNAWYANFNFSLTKDIKSISCFVPEPDSEKWIAKTIDLYVQEPLTNNSVTNILPVEFVWNVNQTNEHLKVELAGGFQSVLWIKGNQIIAECCKKTIDKKSCSKIANVNICHERSSSNTTQLNFKVVNTKARGYYMCIVRTETRELRKLIHLEVNE